MIYSSLLNHATAIAMIELCNDQQHSVDEKHSLRGMPAEQYNRWRGFVVVRCIYVWAYSSTMCVLVCGTSLKNRTTV